LEEEPHLDRFDLGVADFVDQERIVGQILLEDRLIGMIGDGAKEFAEELGEENVPTVAAPVNLETAVD